MYTLSRQQGQPVQTSMSVVVQEMVASEISGVLFTNDPVTGNPNKMVLDASFGLGEVCGMLKLPVLVCTEFILV